MATSVDTEVVEVYLDHAASTPLRPEAQAAWLDASARHHANPTGAHRAARAARRALDDARDEIAAALDRPPAEVVFTSGGSEADNLAIRGVLHAQGGVAVCSAGEHHAVLGPVEHAGGLTVELEADGTIRVLRIKNRFRDGAAPGGYRDMNVNVRFRGLVCEVQLHAGPYLTLKEGAHHSYELCRSLDLVGELESSTQEDDAVASAPRWLWCMLTVLRLFASMYCFAMALLICYFYGYGMTHGQWDGGIKHWDGGMQTSDPASGWVWAVGLGTPYALVGILLIRDIAARIGLKTLVAISASLIGVALAVGFAVATNHPFSSQMC